ncbi:hypothetical protein E3O25_06450 [Cryobacterium sp. TMT1-3]|nr:hypothetical protein [Cryobacterium sp. TMT1-3]TFC28829.1 hypothetical protein E3O25_06450 [Cryobacterium sp. TMT1-3]
MAKFVGSQSRNSNFDGGCIKPPSSKYPIAQHTTAASPDKHEIRGLLAGDMKGELFGDRGWHRNKAVFIVFRGRFLEIAVHFHHHGADVKPTSRGIEVTNLQTG